MAKAQSEIIEGLARCELFACLNSAAQAEVADLCTINRFAAGTVLANEGEVGFEMYVLLDGLVEAFTHTAAGEVVLQRLDQPGHHCGELALRPDSNGRRAASIRVVRESRAIVVPRGAFQDALAHDPALEEGVARRAEHYARQLSLVERSALYRALVLFDREDGWSEERRYQRGDLIFSEGDPGQEVFIIQSGSVRVTRSIDGSPRLLALLGEGQTFGELAVVGDGTRQATVTADADLVVRVFDRARFLDAMGREPEIHHYLRTLRGVYQLGSQTVTQFDGELAGEPALVTICRTDAGHEVIATHVVTTQVYDAQAQGETDGEPTVYRFEDRRRGIVRELAVRDGVLAGVHAVGPWKELGLIHARLLDRAPLDPAHLSGFTDTGHLLEPPAESGPGATVCHCLNVSRGAIESAITHGHQTLEAVAEATGASTVCGGCTGRLAGMVGSSGQPVALLDRVDLLPDVAAFRFAPPTEQASETLREALPGQHVVISAAIDGHWVHRPYTISSAADECRYREITVKREPHGFFSNWLFDGSGASEFRLSHPKGSFWVDLKRPEPVVLLVAGIGVTPALAVARSLIAANGHRRLHVDYSARTERDFAARGELDQLVAEHTNITVHYRVTGRGERLDLSAVQGLHKQLLGARWFICGPDAFQQDLHGYLMACSVAAEDVHVEVFTPVGHAPETAPPRSRVERAAAVATMALGVLYLVQWLAGWQWPALAGQQDGFGWQVTSGLLLATLILWQWVLPVLRATGQIRAAATQYRWHKYAGVLAPVLLYLHSQTLGYALLFVLASSFLANAMLGAADKTVIRNLQWRERYAGPWLTAHVALSLLVVGLASWHVYFALAYK